MVAPVTTPVAGLTRYSEVAMRRAQLQDLLGVTGGIIADTFRWMEIAEEIADRHFPRPRDGKPSAQNSLAFKVACPPVLLRNKGDGRHRLRGRRIARGRLA